MKSIDLNCDMGEFPQAIADGTQESLMLYLTSVNVACGGHAGDANTMQATIEQARRFKLAVGAHPSYPDREHFGRRASQMSFAAIADAVCGQVQALAQVAAKCGTRLVHVKPHGALYNQAARDGAIAEAVAAGVARATRDLILVGLAGSPALDVYRKAGFSVAAEAFADRRYEADGGLRSREHEDALIRDPEVAARQALSIVKLGQAVACDGSVVAVDAQTICIHGDTPGAAQIAEAIARTLRQAGVAIRPLAS